MSSLNDFFPGHVLTLFTQRDIDFSFSQKKEVFNDHRKEFLNTHLGNCFEKTINIRQVHGDTVIVVADDRLFEKTSVPQADGLITNLKNIPLTIRTADCLPIYLFDPQKECIGLVHAGWKSSQKKIVSKAIDLMHQHYGSRPENLQVAFGPSIQKCCYEVKEEFCDFFPNETTKKDQQYYLDLSLVNFNQLTVLGVPGKNILQSAVCTCCDARYYSYRREGSGAGRMIAVMMLRDHKR